MAISTDYPRPINVNGYVCRNCDDVADAKKFIDPSAPKGAAATPVEQDKAVTFGGSLAVQKAGDSAIAKTNQPPRHLLDRYA